MIKRHDCTGDKTGNKAAAIFQDEKYGKGNRVANELKEGKTRCSICGFEILSGDAKIKAKGKQK